MNAVAESVIASKTREELDAMTHRIIGCAQRVSTELGPGFLERIYENSLCVELRKAGLSFEQQRVVGIKYDDVMVGDYVTDIVVENSVVLEIKAVDHLVEAHRLQCLHYLRATGHRICLLLNFGAQRLQTRRFVLRF